jgi:hypothetical protein
MVKVIIAVNIYRTAGPPNTRDEVSAVVAEKTLGLFHVEDTEYDVASADVIAVETEAPFGGAV